MATLSDVLFPTTGPSEANTDPQMFHANQDFWKAWYPSQPYVGSPAQQAEVMRLRKMQESNVQPQTSQGAVGAQNAAAMQGELMPASGGGVTMPPITAVAPQTPQQSGALEQSQAALQRAPMDIGVIGGLPASTTLATPASPATPKPPVEGFSQMLQAPASQVPPQAPSMAPQQQVPQQQPAPAAEAAKSKWQGFLDNLKNPSVMGPLQTFFGALAAPLAPWETTGSRIGRASMLMQMHKGMLSENERTAAARQEKEQLALEEARQSVAGKTADTSLKTTQAKVAAALQDTTIQKAQQDLKNAQVSGDKIALDNAEQTMKNRLLSLYGDEKEAADIFYKLKAAEAQGSTSDWNKRRSSSDAADTPEKQSIRDAAAAAYQEELIKPFDAWRRAQYAADPASPIQFDDYLSAVPAKKTRYTQIMNEFTKAGGKVGSQVVGRTTTAESPAAGADKFTVGKTYKDANGNVAAYLGNGKWESK